MTAPVPTNEPLELRAGITWQWTRSFPDYPATTWALTYWCKQLAASGFKFSIAASASGSDFAVSVLPATNDAYVADDYSWVAVVVNGTDTREVDRGTFKLLPKYTANSALDDRSHARKVLEAIEAVLETRATVDQQEYQIGSRMLKRMTQQELRDLRNAYRAEVFAEDNNMRRRNGYNAGRVVAKL